MDVKKIVYVTNGERDHNGLTHAAEVQLNKVAMNVLEGENQSLTKAFRTTKEMSPTTSESLRYLSSKVKKTTQDTGENFYLNILKDPINIDEINKSTKQGEVVVVGITRRELLNVLDTLKREGYNIVNKEKCNHIYNVYAVTIDPEDKKNCGFFEAHYGE